ncbi:unnamed protein product [Absidia cylindrospora]
MDLATILNPSSTKQQDHYHFQHKHHQSSLHSPPISPKRIHNGLIPPSLIANMKPRSRFSALEDAIICQGVANGLTWGQISGQLPHRKRATCFNRYRTLQGVRKSRPQSALSPASLYYYHHHQPYDNSLQHYHYSSSSSSSSTIQWLPSPPPSSSPPLMIDPISPSIDSYHQIQPSINSSISSSVINHSRRASTLSSNIHHYHPY